MNKRCGQCKEPKAISKFHKDKSRRDGLNVRCKDCAQLLKTPLAPAICAEAG